MELYEQVCAFELSRRLNDLGVIQKSLFWWIKRKGDIKTEMISYGLPHFTYKDPTGIVYDSPIWENTGWEFYSAFTVAELGDMLPNNIPWSLVRNNNDEYIISGLSKHEPFTCNTEADARAKMIIYLIEHDLHFYGEKIKDD